MCNDEVHGLAYMNDTGENACRHCERHAAKFISSFRSFARRVASFDPSFVVAHTQFNLTRVFRIIITTTHELLCSIVVVARLSSSLARGFVMCKIMSANDFRRERDGREGRAERARLRVCQMRNGWACATAPPPPTPLYMICAQRHIGLFVPLSWLEILASL